MRFLPLRAYLATVQEITPTRKLQVARMLAAENLGNLRQVTVVCKINKSETRM